MSSEHDHGSGGKGVKTYLFGRILDVIRNSDLFLNKTAPTVFLLYAHKSKDGNAMASVSIKIIEWLKRIRAKLRSDRSPLGMGFGIGTSLDSYEDAAHNILSNQLCLLPPSSYEKSVDKVIMCCSETLLRYYEMCLQEPTLQGYPDEIKAAHSKSPKEPERAKRMHSQIEDVIVEYQKNQKFHHVLTELIFLDIRKQKCDQESRKSGVIPLILNKEPEMYEKIPGYVDRTDLFCNPGLDSVDDPLTNPKSCGQLHGLFFKLMGRILGHDNEIVRNFKTCYEECAAWSSERTAWLESKLREEFKSHVSEEILKVVYGIINGITAYGRTHSMFDATVLKDLWNVPFNQNDRFVGREETLTKMTNILSTQDSVAVFGLGGVGKTEVVLEFAYRKRKACPSCSIFWVSALDPTTFTQSYLEMGDKLQIPDVARKASNPAELIQAVKKKLSDETSGQWLLIIDHVEIFDVQDKTANESVTGSLPLLDCIPTSPKGSVIFTTRNYSTSYDLAGNNTVEVPAMNLEEAKDLLKKWVAPEYIGTDESVTNKLLELLTHLPLAIIQAGTYMMRRRETILDYLEIYESSQGEALSLLGENVMDKRARASAMDPVSVTWRISFEQIRRHDKLATDYLSTMACLSSQNIPKSLLPPSSSIKDVKQAISTLKGYSFITEQGRTEHYNMQSLVHLATQDWLKNPAPLKSSIKSAPHDTLSRDGTQESWIKQTILRITEVFPDEQLGDRASWVEYLPHATYALFLPHSSKGIEKFEIQLLRRVVYCLQKHGQYMQAEKAAEKEVRLRVDFFGENDPATLTSMSNWAFILDSRLGRYDDAEVIQRRAIKLRKNIPGSEDTFTLSSMSLLALTLSHKGELSEAKKLTEQVLARRIILLGPEAPNTLTSKSRLGAVLSSQGKYEEAEAIHRQVLKARETSLGADDPDTVTSKVHLAVVLKDQKKYQEAEELYKDALKPNKKIPPEHPSRLSTMSHLGSLLYYQGKYADAEKLHTEVLSLRENKFGPKNHQTLLSMNNVALVLVSLDRLDEAEDMQNRALDGLEKLLNNPNHQYILSGMANLACIYIKKGMVREAGGLATKIIERAEGDISNIHLDTITGLSNMLFIYIDRGQLEVAEKMGVKLLEMAQREIGDQNCHTLDVKCQLSSLRQKQQEKMKDVVNSLQPEMNTKKRRMDDGTADSDMARKKQKV